MAKSASLFTVPCASFVDTRPLRDSHFGSSGDFAGDNLIRSARRSDIIESFHDFSTGSVDRRQTVSLYILISGKS